MMAYYIFEKYWAFAKKGGGAYAQTAIITRQHTIKLISQSVNILTVYKFL